MKATQLFILALGLVALTACGDDSSNSGSSEKYTGSKADITGAKKLVHEYQDNNFFFEKGYVSYNKVKGNLLWAETYSGYAQSLQELPTSYYAMRHVGCLAQDGSLIPSEQDKHTQMDVVVGERDARAVYVQKNSLGRCYLGQVNWGHNLVLNGQVLDTNSRSRGVFGLPTDACQDYIVDQAMVRVTKEKLGYNSNDNSNSNYWNYRHRWSPDRDFYYDVKGNRFSQFTNHNVVADSAEDSFGKITSSEAVFVTKAIRSRSSGPSCAKDVYWGFVVDPANPPEIQILGRN